MQKCSSKGRKPKAKEGVLHAGFEQGPLRETLRRLEDFRALGPIINADSDILLRTTYHQLGMTFGFSYFVLGGKGGDAPAPAPAGE
jgi:hypothetical protein